MAEDLKHREDEAYLSALVNLYYLLSEANDLIIRKVEKILEKRGAGYKQNLKFRHNQLMDEFRKIKNIQENYFKDYTDTFGENWGLYYDEIKKTSNYIVRLLLLISDRTYNDEDIEKQIEMFIHDLPPMGRLTDEQILEFKLR